MQLQVVEAAARRALAAERAQQQALQNSRQQNAQPVQDDGGQMQHWRMAEVVFVHPYLKGNVTKPASE